MAVTVTAKGRTTSTTSGATQTVNYSGSLAAGRTVLVAINAPTGSTNTSMTVTDNKGNTFAVQQSVFHNAYAPAVAVGVLTSAVTSSDVITVTLAVGTSTCMIDVYDLGVVGSIDVSGAFPNDGGTHSTATVSSSAAATAAGQIVFGIFANTNTTHAFTAGSGFTGAPAGVNQTGTGSTARQMWVEWQEYATGAGAVRTASGAYATAANYAGVVVAINVTPGGGGGGGGWAPTNVGETVNTTASTTKTVTLTAAVPANHHLVLVADVPSGTPITTATAASTGNTWTPRVVSGDSNFAPVIIDCIVGTAMTVGQTITVTVSNSSTGWKIVVLDLGAVGAYDTSGVQAAGTTTASPSVATGANAAINHQYAIAIFCNTNTTHNFTPGTGWTALPGGARVTGSGSTSNNLWVAYREYTADSGSPRTADGAFATAGNYAAAVIAVNADADTNIFAWIGGAWVPCVELTWNGTAYV